MTITWKISLVFTFYHVCVDGKQRCQQCLGGKKNIIIIIIVKNDVDHLLWLTCSTNLKLISASTIRVVLFLLLAALVLSHFSSSINSVNSVVLDWVGLRKSLFFLRVSFDSKRKRKCTYAHACATWGRNHLLQTCGKVDVNNYKSINNIMQEGNRIKAEAI